MCGSSVMLASMLLVFTEPATPPTADSSAGCRQGVAFRHYGYGLHLYSKKDDQGAVEQYTKSIAADPKQPWAYYRRGNILANQDKIREAITDFQKVAELDDSIIFAHYNLACLYSQQGEGAKSLASLEAALKRGYRKFDKLQADTDLQNARKDPRFGKLVVEYRKRAAGEKLSVTQRFQTAGAEDRLDIVARAAEEPDGIPQELGLLASYDPVAEVRLMGMHLLVKQKHPARQRYLVMGIFDTDGRVCKVAGNHLQAKIKLKRASVSVMRCLLFASVSLGLPKLPLACRGCST